MKTLGRASLRHTWQTLVFAASLPLTSMAAPATSLDGVWKLSHPQTAWSNVRTFAWRPDLAFFEEYNCEHQVGAKGGVARYGVIPEPPEDDITPPATPH